MTTVNWSPNLPCPKGCRAWDSKGTFAIQSVIASTEGQRGLAFAWCVLCQGAYAYEFNPDIPFEHQSISLVANPDYKSLRGRLSKVSKKKRGGNSSSANDNR
jgi:hypothetical protein